MYEYTLKKNFTMIVLYSTLYTHNYIFNLTNFSCFVLTLSFLKYGLYSHNVEEYTY